MEKCNSTLIKTGFQRLIKLWYYNLALIGVKELKTQSM